jgi:hypothetical protein
LYTVLQVGGESEALFIYTLLSPVALAAILALITAAGRWAVASEAGD